MNTTPNGTTDVVYPLTPFNHFNVFLALIGIGLNLLVLGLCLRHVRQNSFMWFVLNLAIADALASFQGIFLTRQDFLENDHLCRAVPAMAVVALGAAISSHPMLGLNRYVAIERPAWYPRIFENRRLVPLLLSICWIFPIAFAVMDYTAGCLERNLDVHDELSCYVNASPDNSGICLFPKIGHFTTCYTVLLFCYCTVYRTLRRQQRQLEHSGLNNSRLANDQQLLKLMALQALTPISLHFPAVGVVIMFPQIRDQYRIAGKLTLGLLMFEPVLSAILTLTIVKLFRTTIATSMKRFIDWARCPKTDKKETPVMSLKKVGR